MVTDELPEARLTDRELLLLVAERQRSQHEQNSARFDRFEGELKEMGHRVTELERQGNSNSGFFRGVEWLRGLIASLPVGVAAYFVGKGDGP